MSRRTRSSSAAILAAVRRRRRRTAASPSRLLPLLAVLAALAAGVAAFLRRRGAGAPGPRPEPGSPPSQESATKMVHQEWTCQCGQAYRVSGEGRHRIYWLPDAPVSDPVTEGRCVSCQQELPGDQASPVDEAASAER